MRDRRPAIAYTVEEDGCGAARPPCGPKLLTFPRPIPKLKATAQRAAGLEVGVPTAVAIVSRHLQGPLMGRCITEVGPVVPKVDRRSERLLNRSRRGGRELANATASENGRPSSRNRLAI